VAETSIPHLFQNSPKKEDCFTKKSLDPGQATALPGIGSVILNEQTCNGGGVPPCSGTTNSGIRVRVIHVIVDSPNALGVPQGADVIAGEAHADSAHP